jgi:hypothetical protein
MGQFDKFIIGLKAGCSIFRKNPGWNLLVILFILYGCAGHSSAPIVVPSPPENSKKVLPLMGFSIQVGAFSNIDNAFRLNKSLQEKGYDSYYFFDDKKFYKVRFGNYPSWEKARAIADDLRTKGIIAKYIIIKPEDYLSPNLTETDNNRLRKELVKSAESFIGMSYYWGGVSGETGFDCSGLAMAVYKLNGLNLPRTTNEQWSAGKPVDTKHISHGDLVFFSIKKTGYTSHVGIYIGGNKFIHAPGEGKKIRVDSLSTEYFQKYYSGARSYLR